MAVPAMLEHGQDARDTSVGPNSLGLGRAVLGIGAPGVD